MFVATVTAEVGAITNADGACTAADYVIANAVSTVGEEIAVGDPSGTWGTSDTPTIAFNNSPTVNQDGCQNADVAIDYTIDAP